MRTSRRPPAAPNLPAGATVDWTAARIVVGFSDLRGAETDVVGVVDDPGREDYPRLRARLGDLAGLARRRLAAPR